MRGEVSSYGVPDGPQSMQLVPRLVFDTAGQIVDTAGFRRFPAPGAFQSTRMDGDEVTLPRVYDDTSWIEASEGSYVVTRTIAQDADEGTFTVIRLGVLDDAAFVRGFRYRPQPFAGWYIDSMASAFARRRRMRPIEPALLERAVRDNVVLPPFEPPVATQRVSQDGGIWLRRTGEYRATHRWLVLDTEGRPRGEVELPANVTVRWSRGDVLWASVPDDLDVPWLVRYRLVPQ